MLTALCTHALALGVHESCAEGPLVRPTDVAAPPGGRVWVAVRIEGVPSLGAGRVALRTVRRADNLGREEARVTGVRPGPALPAEALLTSTTAAADPEATGSWAAAAWLPPFLAPASPGETGTLLPLGGAGELLSFEVEAPLAAASGDLYDLVIPTGTGGPDGAPPLDLSDAEMAPLALSVVPATLLVVPPPTGPWVALAEVEGRRGRRAEVPVVLTPSTGPVAALQLSLRAEAPPPSPTLPPPTLSLPGSPAGALLETDPADPWRVTLRWPSPVQGPAAILTLAWPVDPSLPPGTVYRLEASPRVWDPTGREQNGEGLAASGSLRVTGCVKGDVDSDGRIGLSDVIHILRTYVLSAPPVPNCALDASDTNCDGLISLADVIFVLRRYVLNLPLPCSD